MHLHSASGDSFQRVTLLSPPATAKIFPVIDQLTLQTTSGNLGRIFLIQFEFADDAFSWVQITTVPSWEQLAITLEGNPIEGPQATSRTQSVWYSKTSSVFQVFSPSMYLQIFIRLSQPPETKRFVSVLLVFADELIRDPGASEGAHDIALTPIACAWEIFCVSQLLSPLCVIIEIVQSEEAPARHNQNSWGAHAIEFTEDSCLSYSKTLVQILFEVSFQMQIRRSYEQDARTEPYLGCAQATCQTGPSCPLISASKTLESISKILIVLSEEHVANLLL